MHHSDKLPARFLHRGRRYTVFRRGTSSGSPFYVHIQRGKKRYLQTLETNVRQQAIERAKVFIDSVIGEKWNQVEKIRTRSVAAKLGPVVECYRKNAVAQPRTIRNNILALQMMIRAVKGDSLDLDDVSLTEVNQRLVVDFQDRMRARYCQDASKLETAQREARDRADRSSRSLVRQARSLFNRTTEIRRHYEDAGLTIPDSVQGFMTARLRGKPVKRQYLTPGDDVIARAFQDIEELREHDPNVYMAFWLAVGAGLRKGEIARVEWSHIVERDGAWWVSGGVGKDGERIEVPIQSKAVDKLREFRKPSGRIIDEGSAMRWARALNAFLTTKGWRTEKKMHELRAYVGSLLYQLSPVGAMRFMRHKSIKVTEDFYCRYRVDSKPLHVL